MYKHTHTFTCMDAHTYLHTYMHTIHTAQPAPYRNGAFFFTDSFLNLTDVVDTSIVVHVAGGGEIDSINSTLP